MTTGSFLSIALLYSFTILSSAQELSDVRQLFRQGKFEKVIEAVNESDEKISSRKQDWIVLKCRSQLATGKYRDARLTAEEALKENRSSIRIREVAAEAFRFNNEDSRAAEMRKEIDDLWKRYGWRYRNVDDLSLIHI